MAAGKIRFGKQSGGQLALVIPDGVTNTEVIFPESGILAKTSDINTAGVELKTIATGTATFTATTNNINLTGIGLGVEIGDVIQISGADDAKNNSEFTIEVIMDANNIIVNQAHASKGTSKNVANRASDTGVTVKLLAKWYNASSGLGQGWVNVTLMRTAGTTYTNPTKREIIVNAWLNGDDLEITENGAVTALANGALGNVIAFATSTISKDGTYKVSDFTGMTERR